jgi:hypothetical protein
MLVKVDLFCSSTPKFCCGNPSFGGGWRFHAWKIHDGMRINPLASLTEDLFAGNHVFLVIRRGFLSIFPWIVINVSHSNTGPAPWEDTGPSALPNLVGLLPREVKLTYRPRQLLFFWVNPSKAVFHDHVKHGGGLVDGMGRPVLQPQQRLGLGRGLLRPQPDRFTHDGRGYS